MSSYRCATYTDENSTVVERVGFHVSDLAEVLRRTYPPKAVMREAVTEYTGVEKITYWHKGKFPIQPRDWFDEQINQGKRECVVVAWDSETGEFLYEYAMPAGTSALRRQDGRTIPYGKLSVRWLRLIEDQYGILNLTAHPQKGGHRDLHDQLLRRLNVQ